MRGVVGEDEAKEFGECGSICGGVSEECGGAFAPDEDFWTWLGGEPVLFAEDSEDVRRREGIWGGLNNVGNFRLGHGESLAQ